MCLHAALISWGYSFVTCWKLVGPLSSNHDTRTECDSYEQDRAVLHANRGQMKRVLGLQDHAIKDCTRAVQLNPEYLKAILRRAEIYEETDKLGRCGLLILGLRAFF